MCIRDSQVTIETRIVEATSTFVRNLGIQWGYKAIADPFYCLLYTSDAADDLLCVDLGGRRIIQKKKQDQDNER